MFKHFLSRDQLYYAVVVISAAVLAHAGQVGWALGVVIAAQALRWWKNSQTHNASWEAHTEAALVGLSSVTLMGLLRWPLPIAMALFWWFWQARPAHTNAPGWWLARAAINEALALTAIFDAMALWHLSPFIGLLLSWLASLVVARRWFGDLAESAGGILAAAWALIVAELVWVMGTWQVSYVMPGGWLVLPQATVVILSLGYCFSSIYIAHRQNRLSRWRLSEYGIIGLGLLLVVIAGTKWNGSI